MCRPLTPLFLLLLCVPAVAGAPLLFIPQSDQLIVSENVKDMVNGHHGEVIFATDAGVAIYDSAGEWHSARMNRNSSVGLLSDMVTAVEYDHSGRLWIGFPDGLQVYDGVLFQTIQDQQLLKNLCINDIICRGDEVWVATGHSGLHRYANDTWTWFKPYAETELGCREILSMAVDPASDSLVVVSRGEGVWVFRNRSEAAKFEEVADAGGARLLMQQVRPDPFGGVLLANETAVWRYTASEGLETVLTVDDLGERQNRINDVVADAHGLLYVATDRGIFGWGRDGIELHLTAGDGIGSDIVKAVFLDSAGRCWFVVPGAVGYLPPARETQPIGIAAPPEGAAPAAGQGRVPVPAVTAAAVTGAAREVVASAPVQEAAGLPAGAAEPCLPVLQGLEALAGEAVGDSVTTLQRSINALCIRLLGTPLLPEVPEEASPVVEMARNGTANQTPGYIEGIGDSVRGIFSADTNETGQLNGSGVHNLIDRYAPTGMGVSKDDLHGLINRSQDDLRALNRSSGATPPF
ncbi:hypothetical protein FGU65_00505 [Methanoculleus sp. FWC-SCC1]|uniref:Two component regulator propeller n=1 Tax=Methanoculleus frigidifontis TaxID=2584085 RepID=A0ABT8M640_9EURY|nr:hypothetical protein [Methanoculleus sp. FWC-SCC1]MDN7023393.1 hypothetical protein [Methanoculleus sp. FWC-SCC1]